MVNSHTLKRFVKMHEYKMNAKMHGLQTGRLDAKLDELHGQLVSDSHEGGRAGEEHWHSTQIDRTTRHRPKSRYFNFIMTAEH